MQNWLSTGWSRLRAILGRVTLVPPPPAPPMDNTFIVVILGSTGVGKSKLAVQLAQQFNGEIINADAMQMYKGLDIVTNKIGVLERCGVRHHLFDFLSPTEHYIVKHFQRDCLRTIAEIHARNCLPVIVGGTNYYIESILWNVLLPIDQCHHLQQPPPPAAPAAAAAAAGVPAAAAGGCDSSLQLKLQLEKQLAAMSLEERLAWLRRVDPARAAFVHPANLRAVASALQVYMKTGRPISEYLHEQRSVRGAHHRFGGPLRFGRACLLWLTCEQQLLDARLDRRVDTMMQRGLLDELAGFYRNHIAARARAQCTPCTPTDTPSATSTTIDTTSDSNNIDGSNSSTITTAIATSTATATTTSSSSTATNTTSSCSSSNDSDSHCLPHFSIHPPADSSLSVQCVSTSAAAAAASAAAAAAGGGGDHGDRVADRDETNDNMSSDTGAHGQLVSHHYTPLANGNTTASSDIYRHGVFQSIGFKEFDAYLSATLVHDNRAASEKQQQQQQQQQRLLQLAVQRMKVVTRRYARQQLRWVRLRLLNSTRPAPAVYRLDTTAAAAAASSDSTNDTSSICTTSSSTTTHRNITNTSSATSSSSSDSSADALWRATVLTPAVAIVDCLRRGVPPAIVPEPLIAPPSPPSPPPPPPADSCSDHRDEKNCDTNTTSINGHADDYDDSMEETMRLHHCTLCNVYVTGRVQYRAHVQSKCHRHHAKRQRTLQHLKHAPWL